MKLCNRCGRTQPYTEYVKSNSSKDGHQSYCRDCKLEQGLIRKYGLTIQTRQELLDSQGGSCPICNSELKMPSKGNHRNSEVVGRHYAVVDHCHDTGRTRGILCGKCNLMLGKAEDNIEYLKSAIKYLENYT
jgi:ribosomal protein S14